MTVLRSLRGASFVSVLLVGTLAPTAALAAPDSTPNTVPPSTGLPTGVRVASEAPAPGGVGAPRVGPLDASVGGASGTGVWWLFALGGAQVGGLVLITRRNRARLSSSEAAT